jgi:hypothetical protein
MDMVLKENWNLGILECWVKDYYFCFSILDGLVKVPICHPEPGPELDSGSTDFRVSKVLDTEISSAQVLLDAESSSA